VCLASDKVTNDNATSVLKQGKSGKNVRHANRRLAGRREKGGKRQNSKQKTGEAETRGLCLCECVAPQPPGLLAKTASERQCCAPSVGRGFSVSCYTACCSQRHGHAGDENRVRFARSLARLPWCLSHVPWPPMSCHVAEQERTARKRRLWCEMGLCKHPDGVEHNATAVVQRQGK
jgi:hypothetical protein